MKRPEFLVGAVISAAVGIRLWVYADALPLGGDAVVLSILTSQFLAVSVYCTVRFLAGQKT
jgi:hypothetical protein